MKAFLVLFLTLCMAGGGGVFAQDITPPPQPLSGYGSSEYPFSGVRFDSYLEGTEQYWLFEPSAYSRPLPVVVFLHGWGAMNPKGYGNWIRHIVRRGAIVIYPRYQSHLRTPVDEMQPNMLISLKHAFAELRATRPHASVENLVVVGHSLGGVLAANLAAVAAENGLPPPKAVLSIQPGKTWGLHNARIRLEDMTRIPSDTLLLVMTGDKDRVVEDKDAERIHSSSYSVPDHRKYLITMRSDAHGKPPLNANHFSPAAPNAAYDMKTAFMTDERQIAGKALDRATDIFLAERRGGYEPVFGVDIPHKLYTGTTDALDYYGYWKTLDILMHAAIFGNPAAFTDKETLTFMGMWSDGTPVVPMEMR